MKAFVKSRLFPGGKQPRVIRRGLAQGLTFLIDPSEKTQRLLGLDEAELSQSLAQAIRQAGTFIDVGASDGYYTIIAAVKNPAARVIACEPATQLEDDYRENLRLNGLEGHSRVERRDCFVGTDHTTLDALAVDMPEPLVVKIDVEGGELDVLQSGPGVVAGNTTFIIETHSLKMEEQCQKLLREAGYKCQIIRPAWWRRVLPERRPSAHNQWLVAVRP